MGTPFAPGLGYVKTHDHVLSREEIADEYNAGPPTLSFGTDDGEFDTEDSEISNVYISGWSTPGVSIIPFNGAAGLGKRNEHIVLDGVILEQDDTIIYSPPDNAWVVNSVSGEWTTQELSIGEGTITSSDITFNMEGSLVINGKTLQQIIREESTMWTTSNVLVIVLIVIVTVKFVMPRLNWRWWVKKFKNMIFKPAKKQVEEIEAAWKDV